MSDGRREIKYFEQRQIDAMNPIERLERAMRQDARLQDDVEAYVEKRIAEHETAIEEYAALVEAAKEVCEARFIAEASDAIDALRNALRDTVGDETKGGSR